MENKNTRKSVVDGLLNHLKDKNIHLNNADKPKNETKNTNNNNYYNKVLILLTEEQDSYLTKLSKKITKSRNTGERISKSTFIRCLIDILKDNDLNLDLKDINDEKTLKDRINNSFLV